MRVSSLYQGFDQSSSTSIRVLSKSYRPAIRFQSPYLGSIGVKSNLLFIPPPYRRDRALSPQYVALQKPLGCLDPRSYWRHARLRLFATSNLVTPATSSTESGKDPTRGLGLLNRLCWCHYYSVVGQSIKNSSYDRTSEGIGICFAE